MERPDHQTHARGVAGGPEAGGGVSPRVLLFTDTYADVNGPSRFIRNIADRAVETGRDLRVYTSTRLPHQPRRNVTNFNPVLAMKMPRYETLDLTLPPLLRMLRAAQRASPDVIHISTPGPVGAVGLVVSRVLRRPVVGVYHTDFPAYIDRLFQDHVLTSTCSHAMRMFYRPFRAILTRSDDYAASLERLGIERGRVTRLIPGIDLTAFQPGFRDPGIWDRLPAPSLMPGRRAENRVVRVLYCGRVSLEKNLPLLTVVWKKVQERLAATGPAAELVVVGDGPYRTAMEQELAGWGVRFVGFRHGLELSTIYASSDLFVFPSVTDTLGQVVMESQASGLPVLVTDQGGPKEVVHHGESGLVLGAGNVAAWVDAVVALVRDDARRSAMGAAAVAFMARRSIGASFDHFWSVHERVHEEGKAAASGGGKT